MSVIRLETVDSTNLWAKNNLKNLPDGTVVSADRQTKGRGRFNRLWVDLGDDNLFLSIVLKPSDDFKNVYPNLTQYLSVVVTRILDDYGIKSEIKWPNDVLVNGKKICGILSETVTQGNVLKGIVLGIGINLNSSADLLSKITDKEATSLNLELNGKNVDKYEFEQKLLDEFFASYDDFLHAGFPMIKEEYIRKACFINREINVQVFDEIKSGIAEKITDSGELVLDNKGKDLVLTMGDILSWKI